MPLPNRYLDALGPLVEAVTTYRDATGHNAILVGGAAVALHTGGAVMSLDFDIFAGNDDAFELALKSAGFVEDRKAVHGRGWYHPKHPQFAVEQVSGRYFDGRGDRARCVAMTLRDGAEIILPAIEDMIADRLGQHAVSSGDDAMLHQAKVLYALAEGLDRDYLEVRIREEGGDPALLGLSGGE
jgi:hypothetical protein